MRAGTISQSRPLTKKKRNAPMPTRFDPRAADESGRYYIESTKKHNKFYLRY
jgi:hypothetical protein